MRSIRCNVIDIRALGEPSPFTPNVDRACETKQLFFAAAGEMNDLGIHPFLFLCSQVNETGRPMFRRKRGSKKNASSIKGEETLHDPVKWYNDSKTFENHRKEDYRDQDTSMIKIPLLSSHSSSGQYHIFRF